MYELLFGLGLLLGTCILLIMLVGGFVANLLGWQLRSSELCCPGEALVKLVKVVCVVVVAVISFGVAIEVGWTWIRWLIMKVGDL